MQRSQQINRRKKPRFAINSLDKL